MHAIRMFREKLNAGKLCVGVSITFTDPTVTEALAPSVDYVWIDTEHNPMSLESVTGHLIAARACGTAALVRVPTSETAYLKRTLDTGPDGIIVPQIRSADEVRRVVADCRYPPQGQRGFGPRRPSNYGRIGGDEYIKEMNENIFIVAQIEHINAVNELDDILATPSLDSIVIGPQDLSGSMGLLGQVDHPDVVRVIETIIAKTRDAGVFIGMGMGADADYAIRWARKGVQWVQLGCDFSYMLQEVDRLVSMVHSRLREP